MAQHSGSGDGASDTLSGGEHDEDSETECSWHPTDVAKEAGEHNSLHLGAQPPVRRNGRGMTSGHLYQDDAQGQRGGERAREEPDKLPDDSGPTQGGGRKLLTREFIAAGQRKPGRYKAS